MSRKNQERFAKVGIVALLMMGWMQFFGTKVTGYVVIDTIIVIAVLVISLATVFFTAYYPSRRGMPEREKGVFLPNPPDYEETTLRWNKMVLDEKERARRL